MVGCCGAQGGGGGGEGFAPGGRPIPAPHGWPRLRCSAGLARAPPPRPPGARMPAHQQHVRVVGHQRAVERGGLEHKPHRREQRAEERRERRPDRRRGAGRGGEVDLVLAAADPDGAGRLDAARPGQRLGGGVGGRRDAVARGGGGQLQVVDAAVALRGWRARRGAAVGRRGQRMQQLCSGRTPCAGGAAGGLRAPPRSMTARPDPRVGASDVSLHYPACRAPGRAPS